MSEGPLYEQYKLRLEHLREVSSPFEEEIQERIKVYTSMIMETPGASEKIEQMIEHVVRLDVLAKHLKVRKERLVNLKVKGVGRSQYEIGRGVGCEQV